MISSERILELHAAGIEKYGGCATATHEQADKIKGKIENAELGAKFSGKQGDHLHIASLSLKYIAQDQVFVDGNKRTAWMVAIDILQLIGAGVDASQDEAYSFVMRVVNDKLEADTIVEWLSERVIAIDYDSPAGTSIGDTPSPHS